MLGKKCMGYASGNFSDCERHKQRGSTATDYNAVDKKDEFHPKMMEIEPYWKRRGNETGEVSC